MFNTLVSISFILIRKMSELNNLITEFIKCIIVKGMTISNGLQDFVVCDTEYLAVNEGGELKDYLVVLIDLIEDEREVQAFVNCTIKITE